MIQGSPQADRQSGQGADSNAQVKGVGEGRVMGVMVSVFTPGTEDPILKPWGPGDRFCLPEGGTSRLLLLPAPLLLLDDAFRFRRLLGGRADSVHGNKEIIMTTVHVLTGADQLGQVGNKLGVLHPVNQYGNIRVKHILSPHNKDSKYVHAKTGIRSN